MKKVLFVCTGSTCRSPMAVWIAQKKAKEQHLHGIKFVARGLFVEQNDKVREHALDAMKLLGYSTRTRQKPTELTTEDLLQADLCFVMTPEQKAIIKSKFNKDSKTIAEAADYVDIADPYGGTVYDYIEVAKQLEIAIEQIFERYFLEDKK